MKTFPLPFTLIKTRSGCDVIQLTKAFTPNLLLFFPIDITELIIHSVMEKTVSVLDNAETPQSRAVHAQQCLPELYASIRSELDQVGQVIQTLASEQRDPQTVVPALVKAYAILLQNQHVLFAGALEQAQRHDFFRYEAASKQFASEVQLILACVNLSTEQRMQEQGNSAMSQLDHMASNNANQFALLEAWAMKEKAARKELERIQREQRKKQREAEARQVEYNRVEKGERKEKAADGEGQ